MTGCSTSCHSNHLNVFIEGNFECFCGSKGHKVTTEKEKEDLTESKKDCLYSLFKNFTEKRTFCYVMLGDKQVVFCSECKAREGYHSDSIIPEEEYTENMRCENPLKYISPLKLELYFRIDVEHLKEKKRNLNVNAFSRNPDLRKIMLDDIYKSMKEIKENKNTLPAVSLKIFSDYKIYNSLAGFYHFHIFFGDDNVLVDQEKFLDNFDLNEPTLFLDVIKESHKDKNFFFIIIQSLGL